MKINRARNIAAGKVLDTLGKDALVESVQVDGKPIDPEKAKAALAAAEVTQEHSPSIVDKYVDKLQDKVDSMTEALAKNKIGRAINSMLKSDPERVQNRVVVDVRMKNGTAFSLQVDVVDARWTSFLQRCSLTAEVGSLVPVIGTMGLAAASAASLVGSVVAFTLGDRALAGAMLRTAAKHLVLAGADVIPFLGDAAAAIAAVVDSTNLKGARGAPSVAQIVDLAALVEAHGGAQV